MVVVDVPMKKEGDINFAQPHPLNAPNKCLQNISVIHGRSVTLDKEASFSLLARDKDSVHTVKDPRITITVQAREIGKFVDCKMCHNPM